MTTHSSKRSGYGSLSLTLDNEQFSSQQISQSRDSSFDSTKGPPVLSHPRATASASDALNHAIATSSTTLNPTTSPLLMADPEPPSSPKLYTVEEVAARLRVSSKTVRRRIKEGTIRTVPIGGRLVRISSDELRRLLSGPALEP